MGWLYAPIPSVVAAAVAVALCLLFTFRIYVGAGETHRTMRAKGKVWADTTYLKAYLIIYDMKRSHPLMQSTRKKFIIQFSGVLFMEVIFVVFRGKFRSKQVSLSVEKQIAGNSWFH